MFGTFVLSESDTAASRVKVDDRAMREAVRGEAAAAAMLAAAEVPGARRLTGAPSLKQSREGAALMTGIREGVELLRRVSAWSGKRLPAAELERRRRELDPLAVYAAKQIIADPIGCATVTHVRGWMDDPAERTLKRIRSGLER